MANSPSDGVGASYRESHLEQGAEYHRTFAETPRRALLWRIERALLSEIVHRFLPGIDIEHLDFACGTGRILGHLAPDVRSAVGVDVSSSMLAVARHQATQAKLLQADLTREDVLGDQRFDLITAFRFFPNAEQELREAAMQELARLLKPRGVLVFNNHRNRSCLRNRLVRLVTLGRRGNAGMAHSEVGTLVEQSGLQVRAVYHAGVLPETERRPLPFRRLVDRFEQGLAKMPSLALLAEDVLYVCSKSQPAR